MAKTFQAFKIRLTWQSKKGIHRDSQNVIPACAGMTGVEASKLFVAPTASRGFSLLTGVLHSPPTARRLEFGVFWSPGERDHIADVFHASDELDQPFESEPES